MTAPVPKPLREVAGVPLIVRIIRALEKGGVREIGIVIGHLGEDLRAGLSDYEHRAKLSFFPNEEYEKPNGTSVLKARNFVTGPTLLLMSDHLWSPQLLKSVASYPVAEQESVLGVDRRIDACFDLDDATKVQVRGDRIVRIGKELDDYNALDTGLFLITPALIEALDAVNGPRGLLAFTGGRRAGRGGSNEGGRRRGRNLDRRRHPRDPRRGRTPDCRAW